MIQLVAATVFCILSGLILMSIRSAAKKPYDGFDVIGGLIALFCFVAGFVRIAWIAFR